MTVFDRYRRWIDDYLDGELDAQRAGNFTRHLATCQDCQTELDQKQQLKQRLKQTNKTAVPQSLHSKLLAAKNIAPEHHYDMVDAPAHSRVFAPVVACMTALVLLTGALFAAWSVGGSAVNAKTNLPQLTDSWSEEPQPLSTQDISDLRREGWNLASLDYLGLHFDKAQGRLVNGNYEVTMFFVQEANGSQPGAKVTVTEQRNHETATETSTLKAANRPGSAMASADEDPHPQRIVRSLDIPAARYTVDVQTSAPSSNQSVTTVSNETASLAGRVLDRIKTTDQGRLQFVERNTDPWDRVVDGLRRLVGIS